MSPPPKPTFRRILPITTQVRSLCRRLATGSEKGPYSSSCGSTRHCRGARQPPKSGAPSSISSVGADKNVVQNIISERVGQAALTLLCQHLKAAVHHKVPPSFNPSKLYTTAGFYITVKASNKLWQISWALLSTMRVHDEDTLQLRNPPCRQRALVTR